ncbi:hypothetical protein ACWEP4_33200 [Streptomyces sp. NPDC004227]
MTMIPELSCVATARSPDADDLPAAGLDGALEEPIAEDAHAPSNPAITAPAPAPVPIRVACPHGNSRSPSNTHSPNTTKAPTTTNNQRPVRLI